MRAGRIAGVVAGVAFAVVAAVGCSNEDASLVSGGTTSTRPPGGARETFGIGDTVQLGDLRLTVHGVDELVHPLNPSTTVSEGRHWIVVDVEVENISTEEINISAVTNFALQDVTNEPYAARTPDRNDGFPELDGDIAAGGSRRGTIIFEVNDGARGLRLFFAGDPLASGSAEVLLS